MDKRELRIRMKQVRAAIGSTPELARSSAALFLQQVLEVGRIENGMIVSVYDPVGHELSPLVIAKECRKRGLQIALPVIVSGERALDFVLWQEGDDLVSSGFGTKCPAPPHRYVFPDVVVVPLLAFDRSGNRMGYGQGHYDETLRRLREKKNIQAVGLAFDEQYIDGEIPVEPHDQKLDMVVTPTTVFDFRAKTA